MSETSSFEPESRRARRIRITLEAVFVVFGMALIVGLPFAGLLAWSASPDGLGEPEVEQQRSGQWR
ncbi:hypothetical protein [Planobispora rosea]|uniref:hypothetical protein n=1 Tax=Planobispora rosea TaxID=35762 RepID=UPI00083A2AC0|nr:hypothetical protein [Planobispora rosea]